MFAVIERMLQHNPKSVDQEVPAPRGLVGTGNADFQPIKDGAVDLHSTLASTFSTSESKHTTDRTLVLLRAVAADATSSWFNPAWVAFTGRSMEQLLGAGWLQAVHPDDRERCLKVLGHASESCTSFRVEYRLIRKAGDYGWVVEIGTQQPLSGALSGQHLATAIETTEHMQAESHLALNYGIACVFSEVHSFEEAMAPILRLLCERLQWDLAELWSIDSEYGVPSCARSWAMPSIDQSAIAEGVTSKVFSPHIDPPWQSGKYLWIEDVMAHEVLSREPVIRRLGLHGMFRLPILVNGKIRAILRLYCRSIRQLDDAVVRLLTAVGQQIGQAHERQLSVNRERKAVALKAASLDAALDGVITVDSQGLVLEFNAAAETMFCCPRTSAIGSELIPLLIPPRSRDQARTAFATFLTTQVGDFSSMRFDSHAMRLDGTEFPVEVALAPLGIGETPLLTIYVRDATARKQSEQAVMNTQARVRQLVADLLLAEERERRRLAMDLHDGLSQTIALTQMKLAALRQTTNGRMAKPLGEIEDLIRQTNATARSIGLELSPPVLHDFGLEPALKWLAENIHERYGIKIELKVEGDSQSADEEIRIMLFRSVRELLINAAKHAKAQRVRLLLERKKSGLAVTIEDDGVGMDSDLAFSKGSGLLSIQERLLHIGGMMRIESSLGAGTKMRLSAPLSIVRAGQRG